MVSYDMCISRLSVVFTAMFLSVITTLICLW